MSTTLRHYREACVKPTTTACGLAGPAAQLSSLTDAPNEATCAGCKAALVRAWQRGWLERRLFAGEQQPRAS